MAIEQTAEIDESILKDIETSTVLGGEEMKEVLLEESQELHSKSNDLQKELEKYESIDDIEKRVV